MQEPRQPSRPWFQIKAAIEGFWKKRANLAIKDIEMGGQHAAQNVVNSRITNPGGRQLATGSYDSSSGMHAEVAAISSLRAAPQNNCTMVSSEPPCKRCAVLLRIFQKEKFWTIKAPEPGEFHSNYPGAYFVPDNVLQYIIQDLISYGIITQQEADGHEYDIKSLFSSFSF